MQSLKPRVDLIKARYGDDKDRVSKETSILYEQAGVDPTAGAHDGARVLALPAISSTAVATICGEGLAPLCVLLCPCRLPAHAGHHPHLHRPVQLTDQRSQRGPV